MQNVSNKICFLLAFIAKKKLCDAGGILSLNRRFVYIYSLHIMMSIVLLDFRQNFVTKMSRVDNYVNPSKLLFGINLNIYKLS